MDIVALDIPIALGLAGFLVWVYALQGRQAFVAASQAAGTFAAQVSWGVTISVGRILPILLLPMGLLARRTGLRPLLPFAVYAVVVTLVGSLTWEIPPDVSYFYGEGRVFVQLFNLAGVILVGRATAGALRGQSVGLRLVVYLGVAVVIHGAATLYQLLAYSAGLPLIGVTRSFGLTAGGNAGDVAAFVAEGGTLIVRPGGLAGEPKTAAVVFGIYICTYLFGANRLVVTAKTRTLLRLALALAVLGWIAAFSTSAIIGTTAAVILCTALFGSGMVKREWIYLAVFVLLCTGAWLQLTSTDYSELGAITRLRTSERLIDQALDEPVQASIEALSTNPMTALFGTGMGGSSFIVMKFLGQTFEYAYAPNVGIVYLLIEFGAVGTALLLMPLAAMIRAGATEAKRCRDPYTATLVAVAVSASVISLAGSGIPLGFPLAAGAAAAASSIARKGRGAA